MLSKPIYGALLLVFCVLSQSGCEQKSAAVDPTNAQDAATLPPQVVKVVTVDSTRTGARDINIGGRVQAAQETMVAFQSSGRITGLVVEEGDVVHKGQHLGSLDDQDYALSQYAAEDQVEQLEAKARYMRSELARLDPLAQSGAIARVEVERLRSEYQALQATMKQSQKQVALQGRQRGYTQLYAPYDGVVSKKMMDVGQVVGAGQPVFLVVSNHNLEVSVSLPLDIARDIKRWDAQAYVGGDSLSEISLVLKRVSPEAALQTGNVEVRYSPKGAGSRLTLGSVIPVKLTQQGFDAVREDSRLPASSVLNTGDRAFVWLVGSDFRIKKQIVDVQHYENEYVYVRGLSQGVRVVATGGQKLVEGERVEVYRDDLLADTGLSSSGQ